MKNKKGYISIEAVFITVITVLVGLIIYNKVIDDTRDSANIMNTEISSTDAYMGDNIKDVYYSDFSVNLDNEWDSSNSSDILGAAPEFVEVSSISVNNAANRIVTVEKGGYVDIQTTVMPSNASKPELSWHINRGGDCVKIVRSQDGESASIRGMKKGTAEIEFRATDGSGVNYVLTIDVEQPVEGMEITPASKEAQLSFSGNREARVLVTLLPTGADSPNNLGIKAGYYGSVGSECYNITIDRATSNVVFSLKQDNSSEYKKLCAGKQFLAEVYSTANNSVQTTVKVYIDE